METKKDIGMVVLAGLLGLGGGGATNLFDLGGIKEKVESCEKQNGKQWEKIGDLIERIAKLEGHFP